MKKLRTQIASLVDRENLVFEIFFGDSQVAEISHEPDQNPSIEIYSSPDGFWKFDFLEFQTLLEKGIQELKK